MSDPQSSPTVFAQQLVEFIGTFFLVFTIGMTVLAPGAGVFAPVAIVGTLIAMIYAGGHISGAHYNPSASIALMLRGVFPKSQLVPYIVAQCAAGASAAFTVLLLKDGDAPAAIEVDILKVLISEFLFTFALCFVILLVATTKKTEGNQYYGLAIGFIVLGGAYAVGSISGGSFNPAVTLALVVFGLIDAIDIWVYLVAQLAAAVAAHGAFKACSPDRSS